MTSNKHSRNRQCHPKPHYSWWAGPATFLATLLALPVNAGVSIPSDPLTTGSRVAPNILFILDDSSSMGFTHMYRESGTQRISGGGVTSTPTGTNTTTGRGSDSSSSSHMYDLSHVTNTLYYNPAIDYEAWMQADKTRMTGGRTYTAAYGDDYRATAPDDLSQLSRYFYVLKNPGDDPSNASNYYRYEIVRGGGDILRSELGQASASGFTTVSIQNASGTLSSGTAVDRPMGNVPAGVSLEITVRNTTTGRGSRNLTYRVYSPSGQEVCGPVTVALGASHTCVVGRTESGVHVVRLQRSSNNNTSYNLAAQRYTSNACGGERSGNAWVNCISARPVLPNGQQRSLEAEKNNFATWYSYHRTRMKAAKAGASEAFASLDSRVRVGFDRINNQVNLPIGGTSYPNPVFRIPVDDGNDGRFVDTQLDNGGQISSKSDWYAELFGLNVSGVRYTPLRYSLDRAGKYFMRPDSRGPYGPQADLDQYSCRQNFAILTTDGYWNDAGRSPTFGGLPSRQGNADNTEGSLITGPRGQSYRYNPASSENSRFKDDYSNTLADVAMYYWKTDLRDLENNVPSSDANPAFWQHMVTFGISIGLSGAKGWGSVNEVPNAPNWNSPLDGPTDGDADRIDDLLHAALNGRGAFVAASNPSEFRDGLSRALEDIAMRTSSASNVAANSVSLNAGARVFNASYVSGSWAGDLSAREVTAGGVSNAPIWSATIPQWNTRKIYTYSSDDGGAAFPTNEQIDLLAIRDVQGSIRYDGATIANYVKGYQGSEMSNGGPFRVRTRLLGDIVGSSPAYVPGGLATPSAIYVGANDGMLHAFDASNGRELFAYIPGLIDFGALSSLSSPEYAHKFFVDGPVVVSSTSMIPSHRVLVGALGRGGKGVYALDVTSPQTFNESHVMWERGETPGGNMGLVLGRPLIAEARGVENAVVVLGNGVNSASEKAVLVVLDAISGEVIREIDTETGSAEQPNGLFVPTAVLGPDGRSLAHVYAGDMLGNVWKFDLTSDDPDEWGVVRLFTARDEEGNSQPISAGIAVATHPVTNKRWIFFGTGRYLTSGDVSWSKPQSIYGFMDEGTLLTKSELQQRTIAVTDGRASGYPVRAFQAREALPSDKNGWYLDLPEAGERIVQDAQVVSTFLITASMIPIGNACDPDGRGYINALDAFTGTSAGGSYFDLDNTPGTDDRVEGLPVGSVDVNVGMPTLPNLLRGRFVVGGSGGAELGGAQTLAPRWDRASWREIRGD